MPLHNAPITLRRIVPAGIGLCIAISCGVATAQSLSPSGERDAARQQSPGQTLERRIYESFVTGDYAQAVTLIRLHLETSPNDADMLYNLACAYCLMEDFDHAASSLLRAFRAGFTDFEHMRTDPDLEGLRTHPTFRRILDEADRTSNRMTRDAVAQWRDVYGVENYRYESDPERRINYAVALDDHSLAAIRSMLEALADQVNHALFDGQTASYSVLIAVPTPDDADKFFGGKDDIGGMYQHPLRRLIARDIGASLRHEFFHALHYADMERTRQRHPLWIQEGLASLYEDYEIDDAGEIRFIPNDRQILVKARARAGRLIRWKDLFPMDAQAFMARPQQHYPQVRSIFEFVADQGKLVQWYKAYVRTFRDDPTSAKAFEEVFGLPLDDIEREWRKWVVAQPEINLNIREGDAALGIRSGENLANDGVLITEVIAGSSAARSRMRRGDVIVSVDGRVTASIIELRRIIAGKSVGDVVEIKLRRGTEYLTANVTLRPLIGGF